MGDSLKKPFLWGVANAAFQVEGSPLDSDWYRWTHQPGKILDQSNADFATDFWNRYEEDLKLAKDLGSNAFRLSLAWERIEPSHGHFDLAAIEHYRKILRKIIELGMKPVVTLHHFVIPAWQADRGGVLDSSFPEAFQDYAFYVVNEFPEVQDWITFNEPNVLIRSSFVEGEWPPGFKNDFKNAALGAFYLAKAHLLAVKKIKSHLKENPSISSSPRFGIAVHWRVFQPKRKFFMDRLACKIADWLFNRQITSSCMTGKIKIWFPGAKTLKEDLSSGGPFLDFIGINYYGRTITSFAFAPPFVIAEEGNEGKKNDMGWEIYPAGLTQALEEAKDAYGLPILITENGLADQDDSRRSEFIQTHLKAMNEAIQSGVKVEGYLHWSLTDNFEWAHGLKPCFGLVEINYQTQKRTPRPSYFVYQKWIQKSKNE